MFFNLFQREEPQVPPLIRLTAYLTDGDAAAVEEMSLCLRDPKGYAKNHRDQYEARWLAESEETTGTLQWLGLADYLLLHGYAAELDWKCELDAFICGVNHLQGVAKHGLFVDAQRLDEEGDVKRWSHVVSRRWKGFCLAGMDLGSDSYLIFPAVEDTMPELRRLAEQLHQRIALVENL